MVQRVSDIFRLLAGMTKHGVELLCVDTDLAATADRDLHGFTPGFWCELISTHNRASVC